MQFIHLSNISYTYEGQYQPVFSNITFDIAPNERIALIGNNGEGKTTILKIIMGELSDFQGEINYPKKKPRIGYLPQDMSLLSDLTVHNELLATNNDFYEIIRELTIYSQKNSLNDKEGVKLAGLWEEYNRLHINDYETKITSILADLDLAKYADTNCQEISEGEKTRLQLGKLLVNDPDILILDEPTNHLDLENMLWLEEWLCKFPGAILYVSHDRVFINQTATKIIELKRGSATIRGGNYDTFVTDNENAQAHQSVQYQERQKLIAKLHTAARKRRDWARSFQPDTKGEGGGKVFESIFNPVRTMHQQAVNIEKRIEMLQKRYAVEKPWIEKKRTIKFSNSSSAPMIIVTCQKLTKKYDQNMVFQDLYFHAKNGEKIWLSGKNGSGKTTLMRVIAQLDQDYQGEVLWGERVKCAWFDQNLNNLPQELTSLEYTKSKNKEEHEIRNFFGCLGLSGDIVNRQIASLSWGEKTKTQLVKLLTADYNLLLLDEPTNHLDINTRKMLEEALNEYSGTVVFVSHDRAFISNLATREFSMDRY
ncbi:MAG: ATP-binding cassette domain-containing protein [Candidatus Cloacimonetes bacterium]|nr:ATP-binding cassette domain-containing protein [Candidatus Cloacimonadota bacterium]